MPGHAPLAVPQPPREGPLLLGYSGGLDSTVLLHRLATDAALRRHGLRAIHVHHGLHPDADAWARDCARACRDFGVALDTVEVEVARDGGEGLEAAARAARHAAFASALRDGEVLVLAHHRDDQAETFLLRALRASGVDGLAAMRAWRRFGRGWLWRPLLDAPREALRDYARAHGLRWIEDPSNDDDAHDRNFLRLRVLPALRARWPHADAAFARAAGLQREALDLLADADARTLAAARTVDPRCLRVAALAALPAAERARLLRRWIDDLGAPPLPAEGVARIARDLLADAPGDAAEFAWHGTVVRRWRELLWAGPVLPPPAGARADWDGVAPLTWPGGGTLVLENRGQSHFSDREHEPPRMSRPKNDSDPISPDPISPPFVVHARTGGERIVLPGRRHSHALKHVLQDLGVPPWVRLRLPLLSGRDGTLLAAGDLAFSAGFDAWLRATGLRLHWSGLAAA